MFFLANLLALTGDASGTWSSPVLPKLNSTGTDNPLGKPATDDELSWIASISGIGSLIGGIPFIFLPDLIGRKPSILLISIPHMLSFGISALAKSIYLFYIARFLSGVSISACYIVLPMYIAEISENSNRGVLLVSFAIFSHFGSLISYITGPYLSMFWFNLLLFLFPFCFFVSFIFLAPESPYYYVQKKNYSEAIESLITLRRSNVQKNFELELEKIKTNLEETEKGNILNTLKTKHAIKGSIIALILVSFQQLTGQAVFTAYTQQIFIEAGSTTSSSATNSIIVGLVSFFASLLCPLIIDKKGRRFALTISISGIILAELVFGTYYYMSEKNYDTSSVKWLPLACLMSFNFFFGFGMGPMPLTVTSEILPGNVKFLVSTVAGIFGALGSTVMRKNYYYFNNNLHYFGTIWMFAGLCMFLLVFVWFMVPETKGKSFSEILKELDK